MHVSGHRGSLEPTSPEICILGLHYSKKSREAAIVGQVGSAASRSSLLLVHLVSTGIITREYRDMQSISQY